MRRHMLCARSRAQCLEEHTTGEQQQFLPCTANAVGAEFGRVATKIGFRNDFVIAIRIRSTNSIDGADQCSVFPNNRNATLTLTTMGILTMIMMMMMMICW